MATAELPLPPHVERISEMEELIFAAVCEGFDASALIRRRDALLWELEQGDHS
jgi:hypothetical protein